LPTTLSGLSVAVKVACCNPSTYPTALPIFKVQSEDDCSGGRGILACPLTDVTVQIPVEPLCIRTSFPNSCTISPPGAIILTVTVNGTGGQDFPVIVGGSGSHFLNTCDTVLAGSGICTWLITHADGSAVTASRPANPGETIVLYAVGLGFADPSVPTGSPAKSPAFSVSPSFFPLNVSFRVELPPGSPAPPITYVPMDQYLYPAFVGIVSGYVGLYQVNFSVPAPPAKTHPCASFADTNMRIQFASTSDYLDVCVAVLK
jgi:hypothetical protein